MGVSALIMDPKKDGGWRPTLNHKPLNLYLRTAYFTLPTLKTIIPFVHQGWWGVSVDLSSAYYHLACTKASNPGWVCTTMANFTSGWQCPLAYRPLLASGKGS